MQRFPESRGLFMYIVLTLLLGWIYPLYYVHRVSVELNEACKIDGEETPGILAYLFLGIVTLGIYQLVWYCRAAGRLESHFLSHGIPVEINGKSFALWMLLGSLLFGIGPFVAMYKFIHAHNRVNADYNKQL